MKIRTSEVNVPETSHDLKRECEFSPGHQDAETTKMKKHVP